MHYAIPANYYLAPYKAIPSADKSTPRFYSHRRNRSVNRSSVRHRSACSHGPWRSISCSRSYINYTPLITSLVAWRHWVSADRGLSPLAPAGGEATSAPARNFETESGREAGGSGREREQRERGVEEGEGRSERSQLSNKQRRCRLWQAARPTVGLGGNVHCGAHERKPEPESSHL